jgi:hypothetical protein
MSRFSTVLVFSAALLAMAQAAVVVPSPPTLENKAFVLMDFDSGQILAESNSPRTFSTCLANQNDDQFFGRTTLTKRSTQRR